ncbi:MAG: hypothetical protein RL377_753, partial [Bacteroidota bacterium]
MKRLLLVCFLGISSFLMAQKSGYQIT